HLFGMLFPKARAADDVSEKKGNGSAWNPGRHGKTLGRDVVRLWQCLQRKEHYMSLTEVLPSVQSLSLEEKRDLHVLLGRELATQPELLIQEGTHEWWSPHEAYEAARILQEVLDKDRNR